MRKAALLLGLVAVCAVPVFAVDNPTDIGLLHVHGLNANVRSLGKTAVGMNAGLSYNTGKLDVGASYLLIGDNPTSSQFSLQADRFDAIGNARGPAASLRYNLGRRIRLSAGGEILTPYNPNGTLRLRRLAVSGDTSAAITDTLTHWKAGIQYGLSSANAISLGYEEGKWDSGLAAKERYITIGLDRALGRSSSLKLLYQISDYKPGDADPYGNSVTSRDGVASAQLEMKF